MQAVHGDLKLAPTASAFDALKRDYLRMIEDGLLFDEAESFETLMSRCATIQALVKASRAKWFELPSFASLSIECMRGERIPMFTLRSSTYLCVERIRKLRKVIGREA